MEDLENVILNGQHDESLISNPPNTETSIESSSSNIPSNEICAASSSACEDKLENNAQEIPISVGPLSWPLTLGNHIAVNFDTGFYIGEVLELHEHDQNQVFEVNDT